MSEDFSAWESGENEMSSGSRLVDHLRIACRASGLRIQWPYSVTCPDGTTIHCLALIESTLNFERMLIITDFDTVRDKRHCLDSEGYGFSTLQEPPPGKEVDVEGWLDIFREWGLFEVLSNGTVH